jgi:nanoRNase/pAp phosphatase (c-di-AMP/oligoRNAs hydrolase)
MTTRSIPKPTVATRTEQIEDIVGNVQAGAVFTIIITQVDPDAVGSAFAMQELLHAMGAQTKIYYCGGVGHPQNRAIVNKFNLKSKMEHVCKYPEEYLGDDGCLARAVLVDSSLTEDSRLPEKLRCFSPLIVVDHHRGADVETTEYNMVWIEDLGSASTMMVELLQHFFNEMGEKSGFDVFLEENKWLATLLALGIYTDTSGLQGATHRDRKAYDLVSNVLSFSDLDPLINYPLPPSHYINLASALNQYDEQGSYLVSGVGYMNVEDGDDLSTIADYFLRKDGISLAIVWGIIDGKVRISARNSNLSDPLDDFITRFGPFGGAKLTPDGRGEGGAMLKLDLGDWLIDETKEIVEKMVRERINAWVFAKKEA